jgi:hypothetical protein
MKYIKLFEAFDRWSRDQKSELQDYCETNLAYLMDEGFKIRINKYKLLYMLYKKLQRNNIN